MFKIAILRLQSFVFICKMWGSNCRRFFFLIHVTDQAKFARFTSLRETIENECNTFEIYQDVKERMIFSYG